MRSIRGRLTLWLLIAIVVIAMVQGVVTYRAALRQTDALFDYHIRQLALALQDHPGVASPLSAASRREDYDFVVHIWSQNGERIYQSHAHESLPDRTVLGYSTVLTTGGAWRVFGVQAELRTIQVAQPMRVRQRLATETAFKSLAPLLPLAAILALAVILTVRGIVRPLARLSTRVQARGAGDFAPLPAAGLPTEVTPLIGAFNHLLQRLNDALAAQRAFVADAAHELRSPVAALKLQLQLLERATDERTRAELATRLAAGIDRATRLIDQLLTLARSDPDAANQPLSIVRVDEVIRLALADTIDMAQARRIDLGVIDAQPAQIEGDKESLRVLVRNLLDNAVRYTPEGGRVDVSIRISGANATLAVADSGPGIPAGERERVFDRFYRRAIQANDGTGSGLGLAIVRAIAERHQATVTLAQSSLGGLMVNVTFRLAEQVGYGAHDAGATGQSR